MQLSNWSVWISNWFHDPDLNDWRMLKEGRVTDKANVVYLQLKFLPTYVRFGGQDGGEDDVGEPFQKGKKWAQSQMSQR